MGSASLKIFVADWVPLGNKGEEAIIRGIEDMLGRDGEIEIGLFGNVQAIHKRGNLTVFPRTWVYRISGAKMTGKLGLIAWILTAVGFRCGLYGRMRRLQGRGGGKYRELAHFFRDADIILVGHDGVFCPETCIVIMLAREIGKRVGTLGTGASCPDKLAPLVGPLYRKAISAADFWYVREQNTLEMFSRFAADPSKVLLAPDPAFAMASASADEAAQLLEALDWYRHARRNGRAIVLVTVCRRSIVFHRSFVNAGSRSARAGAHFDFVAHLLEGLVNQHNVQVAFLPHSIEEGDGNDVETARMVVDAMRSHAHSTAIIDMDLTPRQLKAIIQQGDFLIAERTHSMIASVDVATPFVGLTNTSDRRTHDIIGKMCDHEDHLIDMDRPDSKACLIRVLTAFEDRQRLHEKLGKIARHLRDRLVKVSHTILGKELRG